MKTIKTTVPRFAPMHGWVNRILRIDLSNGSIRAHESSHYLPRFLGARGLAARIVWEEYPEPIGAFDARNPLMIMPGALTGTISPYSGRTYIGGFSPQSLPHEWFTRSNIGAVWGAELKRAGYDGIVVTGASSTPVRILIQDDDVSILPADELWGLDTMQTQERIQAEHGKAVKTLAIGPAGERLSRIATIQTDVTSVSGQGGFGAVMGSKKLKAVAVVGTGRVPVADAERLQALFRAIGDEVRTQRGRRRDMAARTAELQKDGGGTARLYACTASCPAPCRTHYSDIPGCAFQRKWSGAMNCVSDRFVGGGQNVIYDWNLGFRGGFEQNMYANCLGLNHWELLVGMVPWLRMCSLQGMLKGINGRPLDLNSNECWSQLLHDIAYREGDGDALAEGGWRAASLLSLGEDIMPRYYTAWGYAGHWDGHASFTNPIVFPFWLVGALHWAMDTRDPMPSMHGYVENVMFWGPFAQGSIYPKPPPGGAAPITWDHMRGIAQRAYGRADALDPLSGYDGKAVPAAAEALRSVMKDTLPLDDRVFPLYYSYNTEDRFCRIDGIDGTDLEAAILRAGTGLGWDTQELAHACERVLSLERAITVRHWGRTRTMDERVLPAFEYDENWVSPKTGQRLRLDRTRFGTVMDEYYRLQGWDPSTGWPTAARLSNLGLGGVHAPMVAGARTAQQRLPKLADPEPVVDWHALDSGRTLAAH